MPGETLALKRWAKKEKLEKENEQGLIRAVGGKLRASSIAHKTADGSEREWRKEAKAVLKLVLIMKRIYDCSWWDLVPEVGWAEVRMGSLEEWRDHEYVESG